MPPLKPQNLLLVAIGVLAIIGLGTQTWAQEGTVHDVEANDELEFSPETINIQVGDTVRWTNVGNMPHTVTSTDTETDDPAERQPNGEFDEDLSPGEEVTVTFDEAGEFHYYCQPHNAQDMIGTVIVAEQDDDGTGTGADAGADDSESNDAPGPAVAWILLLVAALVLVSRRR